MTKKRSMAPKAYHLAIKAVEKNPERYQRKSLTDTATLLGKDIGFYVPDSRVDEIFEMANVEREAPVRRQTNPSGANRDRSIAKALIQLYEELGVDFEKRSLDVYRIAGKVIPPECLDGNGESGEDR
jgi:hypothetical protein